MNALTTVVTPDVLRRALPGTSWRDWVTKNPIYAQYHEQQLNKTNDMTYTILSGGIVCVKDTEEARRINFAYLVEDYKQNFGSLLKFIPYPLSETIVNTIVHVDSTTKRSPWVFAFVEIDAPENEQVWQASFQKKVALLFLQSLKDFGYDGKTYLSVKRNVMEPQINYSDMHLQSNFCVELNDLRYSIVPWFIQRLNNELPFAATQGNDGKVTVRKWDTTIIDTKVMEKKANLRVNYCPKWEDCVLCRGNKKDKPTHINSRLHSCINGCDSKTHKCMGKTIYRCEMVLNNDGTEDMQTKRAFELEPVAELLATRIRPCSSTPSPKHPKFRIPDSCPRQGDNETKGRKTTRLDPNVRKNRRRMESKYRFSIKDQRSTTLRVVRDAIQSCNTADWGNIHVDEVRVSFQEDDGPRAEWRREFLAYTSGAGSKICHNRERGERGVQEHTSATNYFVLTPDGVQQRCHGSDTKVDLRVSGRPCKQFVSRAFPIKGTISIALFCDNQELVDLLGPGDGASASGSGATTTSGAVASSSEDKVDTPSTAAVAAPRPAKKMQKKRKQEQVAAVVPAASDATADAAKPGAEEQKAKKKKKAKKRKEEIFDWEAFERDHMSGAPEIE